MLKWLGVLVLIFGIIGAVVVSTKPWERFKPKPPEWKTEKITRGDVLITVTATGTVNPLQTVMIGSQISGKVKDVKKVSNDHVKKGDVLALLDTDLLESERKSAQVRLNQAKASLKLLQVERENLALKQVRQKASTERKRISVERSRGAMDLAAKNLKRYKDLLAVDATTQTEIDIRMLEEANSRHDLRLMEIDLEQAAVEDKQLEADAKQLDAKEEQTKADIQQAEAALARSETNLSYCTIYSPIDGVVLQHLIEPGQTIAASFQTPNMFKIASDLSTVRIDAALDEADIGKIRTGQEVTFDVDAFRSETFTGRVALVKLQSELKGNLVTYPVLVEAKNPPDKEFPNGKLLPGMTAGLRFVVEKRANVQLLPAAALRFIPPPAFAIHKAATTDAAKKHGTQGTVFVVNAMNGIDPKSVTVGESDGDNYELIEGDVKEGDAIVVGTK